MTSDAALLPDGLMRVTRLAIVIGDPALRRLVATALVLERVDVMVVPSLDEVRDGIPTVTDAEERALFGQPAMLAVVATMRDRAGRVGICQRIPVPAADAAAIISAASRLLADRNRVSG